ncbi:UDP-N-acetylglucosamine 4,6-dehydratase (inverting) [Luteitalea pratensis]|uniref:UDP-N-acetylglucosamine 4,6-dehydratase (Inverting) n=1 Tax=Luteitalea pratensis TaxID=1855912 RepID=A0A143PV54_LUTPR|nr:polysaccharide biosynthesis protein [Luteitalea pratensis]AMY11714.1 UDP-N-acetylglucosamine 4,6-dehydratase (inverting) [Luteitalea pratensis]
MTLDNKRVLVTGGTGSLGQRIVRRLLDGSLGRPARVTVLSRDEAKQHEMRLRFLHRRAATDDVIYEQAREALAFRIGDVRDDDTLVEVLRGTDIVIHAAALKQVPACEYFPVEAVRTNVMGADALVRATMAASSRVETVVGISTDKACKPINVMGMTKAVMERILVEANLRQPDTRFACVRYGNVVASRGSVVPLFLEQIAHGGPVTITLKEMTRFLLTLDGAVDTVLAALEHAQRGEIYVPRVPAARMTDLAEVLIDGRDIPIAYTGIRPGEKIHEIMVSEEECHRTLERNGYYVICPMLPECEPQSTSSTVLSSEYSSADITLDHAGLRDLLAPYLAEPLPAELKA